MILNAYTLYDTKSLSSSPPFFALTHGVATRMVSDIANDLGTSVGRHPADYTLYCIGRFDDAAGILLPGDVREHVAHVVSLVKVPGDDNLFTRSSNGRDYFANPPKGE